ncbi:hypothetical protein PM8797T_13962 [Gimesia maris DSM 8797]|nr:hypothetical protein PM8797T_13962 [Gimesia maris DSM 8797]
MLAGLVVDHEINAAYADAAGQASQGILQTDIPATRITKSLERRWCINLVPAAWNSFY